MRLIAASATAVLAFVVTTAETASVHSGLAGFQRALQQQQQSQQQQLQQQEPLVHSSSAGGEVALTCNLPEPWVPSEDDGHHPSADFWSKESFQRQLRRLSAAVEVPTVSFDDLGDVHNDTRWRVFDEFHQVLESLFPVTHKRLELTKVNRFGLIYTLQGTDHHLRPILLTAHQDVVPVQESSTWTHSPFKPYYDGVWLWGRGSCDCKNNLIGILSAMEALLENDGWKPKRTVVFAFGFDEEIGGAHGAGHIAVELENRWGKGGIEWILDEGGMGLETKGDVIYALPAVHEKSYLDVHLDLAIDGGHSSKPPLHNGIGIMSEIAVALEAHPYRPVLEKGSPYYEYLTCQVVHSPDADPWLGKALREGRLDDAAERLAAQSTEVRYRIQTSQAIDLIQGGAKMNALPESVTMGVNYRIGPHDSIETVERNITRLVRSVVDKYGLSMVSFDGVMTENTPEPGDLDQEAALNGTLRLRKGTTTPKTPISPTQNNPVWDVFSSTVQHVFSRYANTVVPVGDIMTGNTDTRHYWSLSENIYRWSPARLGTRVNVHTIDERLDMTAHIDGLRLYYDLIRNFDAWDGPKKE